MTRKTYPFFEEKSLRIAFLTGSLEKGGAESQLSILADRLRTFGHETCVVALLGGGPWASYLEARAVPVVGLKLFRKRSKVAHIWDLIRLVLVLNRIGPDIAVSFLFLPSVWGALAARIAGVRVIISSRRDCGFQRKEARLPSYIEKLSRSVTDCYVANSFAVRESLTLHEGIKVEQVHVIYNGVDFPEMLYDCDPKIRERFGIPVGVVVIGMMANFWPHKNHVLLVRAAKLVLESQRGVFFVLVGRDWRYRHTVEREIERLGVANHFKILWDMDNVSELLYLIDIGILCSKSEGFSNTILEYMAYGKAVVATRVGGNAEAVVERQTGYLVPPDDPESLAGRIIDLVRNPVKRREMGYRGRLRAERYYKWEDKLREWDSLVRGLANKKGILGS